MEFLFLSHWTAERMSTSERLAAALEKMGHSVLHLVAPCRSVLGAWRYNRSTHPIPSIQLWSPFARNGPTRSVDVLLALVQGRLRPRRDARVVVLQSPWLLPLARKLESGRNVYAALDEGPWVDSRPAVEWADAVFCLSPVQEKLLRDREPRKRIVNIGQCSRFSTSVAPYPRDATPTVVYAGPNHRHLALDILRSVAALPARLLLVGSSSSDAHAMFGGTPPANVEWTGWLNAGAYDRAVARGWVGVVPYDLGEAWAWQCNPDKVYDYLVAGLRVVSTPIPALNDVPGVDSVAPEHFAQAVASALNGYGAAVSSAQAVFGRRHTPEAFAARFLSRVIADRPN